MLKTNIDSGHGGPSGRYEHLKEIALEYTFLLTIFEGDDTLLNSQS
jgi:oligopeptidase B